jgi:hypothetical protein
MIRDAKPGSFNHRQVVGAIADGHGLRRWDLILFRKLHLDAVFANELEIRDGKLTGNVLGDIVDAKYKMPSPAALIIGRSLAPSPMATVCAVGISYFSASLRQTASRRGVRQRTGDPRR